jgi:hypothetical protein
MAGRKGTAKPKKYGRRSKLADRIAVEGQLVL